MTGNLTTTGVSYGSPLAVQTVNTGFGDSTVGDGTSSGGSELDAAYGNISGTTLYLFLAGNFENNGNLCNIFIDDGGSGGQSTLTWGDQRRLFRKYDRLTVQLGICCQSRVGCQ